MYGKGVLISLKMRGNLKEVRNWGILTSFIFIYIIYDVLGPKIIFKVPLFADIRKYSDKLVSILFVTV